MLFASALLLIPLATGLLISAILFQRPALYRDARIPGYGLLLGMLLAPALLRALGAMGASVSRYPFLAICAAIFCTVLFLYVRLRRNFNNVLPSMIKTSSGNSSGLLTVLWYLLLLMVIARLTLLAQEAFVRPLFPFDATMHWATKARVWFAEEAIVPFVENGEWLQRMGEGVWTDRHPDYPPTVPLLQVWLALVVDGWSETAINIPWPMFALSLLLIFYGQARAAGVSAINSMAFCYLLFSLPVLDTHIALAGYADFILAACYCGSLLALHSWHLQRQIGQLLLALVLGLAATQVKNEGFFWALTLLPAGMAMLVSARTFFLLMSAGFGVLILVVLFMPRELVVAGHSFETLGIAFNPNALVALGTQFFSHDSWHLLGLLTLVLLPAAWLCAPLRQSCLPLATALLCAMLLYLFLFTATRFSYGAINFTASARIALHLVPAMLFLLALIWQALLDQQKLAQQTECDAHDQA